MVNSNFKKLGQISALAMVTILMVGCASTPVGPSLTVMPAPGKPFDVFKNDDKECRDYAQNSLNTTADEIAAKNTAKTAVIGAALGAVAGAVANGGSSKNVGTGAAVGLLGGAAMGATGGNDASKEVQRRYDIAYQQCMYSKGNQVPGYAIQKPADPAPSAPKK
ncbi:MAG: glycine zipper family protein [Polynucleobacter victoriensis]